MKTLLVVLLLACLTVTVEGAREISEVIVSPMEGEFWYRMVDPETGKNQGYALLVVSVPEPGWTRADWEMKLTYPGGAYEEQRSMVLDQYGILRSAEYRAGGELIGGAAREGRRLKGEAKDGDEVVPVDRDVPDDAISGVAFLFAAMIAYEDGIVVKRTDLNEAKGFASAGERSFIYKGVESVEIDGEQKELHRVEVKRIKDVMNVWVNESRVVTKIDWGGQMLTILSKESTKHLFKKPEPAVVEVETGPEKLVVTGDFEKFTPEELYDHFTKPDLLKKWWPQEADVERKVGGKYHLSWPEMDFFLRGEVVALDPGKRFAFTWKWDHMKDSPELTVDVRFEPLEGGGTKLTLTHGPYDESEARQKDRAGHLQGWLYALARLRGLR